jgi:polyhydroxyalkanoate synthesis repressor PhaR
MLRYMLHCSIPLVSRSERQRVKHKMKRSDTQPLVIKKYENRRLYNTRTSEYINQDQVAQLVRDGYDLHVVDAVSGQDITRLILAQIVLDDAKTPDSVFPLDLLRQMIIASGKATQESALHYMRSMMEIYQNAYRALPMPLNPFEFMSVGRPQSQPADNISGVRPRSSQRDKQERPGSGKGASEREGSDNELRQRIEKLEKILTKAKRIEKGKKPKSRRTS